MSPKSNDTTMAHVQRLTTGETINQPARDIPVYAKCDVLVIGGGPAGCSAAAAAARMGADVILVERYGHLGGMSTGGFVLWIDRMTDWDGKLVIAGFAKEVLDRLPADSIVGSPKESWGSKDPELVRFWEQRSGAAHGTLTWSPVIDPEMLKIAYNDLVLARGGKLLLHSWAVSAIQEGRVVRGAVFESKSGRWAILGKAVIDATGDGDIAALAGAEFESDIEDKAIHSTVNVAFRWGGVDFDRYCNFWRNEKEKFDKITAQAEALTGTEGRPWNSPRNDVALFMGPRFYGYDCTNVRDLTEVEVRSRRIMLKMLDFYRKNMPGFEKAWILDTAPQIGTRHSRRFLGDKFVARQDWLSGVRHADEIGVCPPPKPGVPNVSVPLGCLVPKSLDNLLVAGRNLSCDAPSHTFLREVPVCWLMGQASGVAAAVSVASGVPVHKVDVQAVRRELVKQGAYLRE